MAKAPIGQVGSKRNPLPFLNMQAVQAKVLTEVRRRAGLTGRNAQPDETRRVKVDKKDSASETGGALLNLETGNSIEDVSRNNLETNAISHL